MDVRILCTSTECLTTACGANGAVDADMVGSEAAQKVDVGRAAANPAPGAKGRTTALGMTAAAKRALRNAGGARVRGAMAEAAAGATGRGAAMHA
jgi:hypothetical protein